MWIIGLGCSVLNVALVYAAVSAMRQGRRLLVPFLRGESSVGRVVGFDADDSGNMRPLIAFTTAKGQRVEYLDELLVRVRLEDVREVRYDPANPWNASAGSGRRLLAQMVLIVALFGGGGVLGMGVTLGSFFGSGGWNCAGLGPPLFVGGLVCVYAVGAAVRRTVRWRARSEAVGVVERVDEGEGFPHPWVRYTAWDGRDVEFVDVRLTGYGPGDEVTVHYEAGFPEVTATGIDRGDHFGAIGVFAFTAVLLFAAAGWAAVSGA